MTQDRLPPEELDALFAALRGGDATARDRLVALLYDDLRRAAARLMRRAGRTIPSSPAPWSTRRC